MDLGRGSKQVVQECEESTCSQPSPCTLRSQFGDRRFQLMRPAMGWELSYCKDSLQAIFNRLRTSPGPRREGMPRLKERHCLHVGMRASGGLPG